ncbi:IPTL-CTERM sorting domain-containing protein [Ottowia oryzae]|nr:IPTL-CTERM sorting domain-containing protein [Ottowia oryzae]
MFQPAQVTPFGGGVFTLNSAYLTAAWNDGLQVRVEAFRSGASVQVLTFTPSATTATLVTFPGMVNVDRVVFSSAGGTLHPGYVGSGNTTHFVLDDVNYTLVTAHAITVAPAPINGTLSCTPTLVPNGTNATCTATPAPGYQVSTFSGCTRVGTSNDCQLTNVTAPATVSATFTPITYPITITPPSNGTLACTPNPVNHGSSATCTATPAPGYQVSTFSGCTRVGTSNDCQLTNVTAPATVSATFALATYTITAANDPNGTLTCTPNPVTHGGNVTCMATPAAGYPLSGFTGCTQVGTGNTCTLTNVTGPATVAAVFTVAIPTLSQWALMLLGLGAAGLGARRLRRAA